MTIKIFECAFESDRLLVRVLNRDIHSSRTTGEVRAILDSEVTQWLPDSWQGAFDHRRAAEWITERQAEGHVLEARSRANDSLVGLMLIADSSAEQSETTELRIGYMLRRDSWGAGLATELVQGFVNWCERQGTRCRLLAGVDPSNASSARVLEKTGFELVDGSEQSETLWFTREIVGSHGC